MTQAVITNGGTHGPKQAKSDEDLADAIEAWEREERELCSGDELMKLTDTYDLAGIHYLVMTLQLILAGKSTLHCMP